MLVPESEICDSSLKLELGLSLSSFFWPPRFPAALPPREAWLSMGGKVRRGSLCARRP